EAAVRAAPGSGRLTARTGPRRPTRRRPAPARPPVRLCTTAPSSGARSGRVAGASPPLLCSCPPAVDFLPKAFHRAEVARQQRGRIRNGRGGRASDFLEEVAGDSRAFGRGRVE